MRELIAIARKAAVYTPPAGPMSAAESDDPPQHVIIHGTRGCGKTFLLNQILSTFSPTFDTEKVLWVRINLTEEFGTSLAHDYKTVDHKSILRHHILAQLTKIVFRYYDPRSDYYKHKPYPLHIIDYMRKVASDEPKSDRLNPDRDVLDIVTAFTKEGIDRPIGPDLIPVWACEQVFAFARRQGYSVIGVLDGLDRLESSADHRRRFQLLFDAATALVASGLATLRMALVSVTRTNTLNTLPDTTLKPHQFLAGMPHVWQVYPVPFKSVLQRRVKVVEGRVPAAGALNLINWPEHMRKFGEFLQMSETEALGGMSFSMFGDNRRAQMQMVQLRYFDYLLGERQRPYLFLESLMLGDRRFPSLPYKYEETERGHLRRRIKELSGVDNQLLPSIFSYPRLERQSGRRGMSLTEGLLLGVRILQVVAGGERLRNQGGDALTVRECSSLLQAAFGYPTEYAEAVVDEMRECEMVNLANRDFPLAMHAGPQRIMLMPKGQYVLNKFVYEVAYLGLAAMRIPTREPTGGVVGYFVAAALEEPGDYLDWVVAKIINSCGLARLLSKINEDQRLRCSGVSRRLTPRQRAIFQETLEGCADTVGMFEFTRDLPGRVREQVREMVESMVSVDINAETAIAGRMAGWWKQWGAV